MTIMKEGKGVWAEPRPLARTENILCWKNYRVTVLSSRLFRVEESDTKDFCDQATQSIWFRDAKPVSFRSCSEEETLTIETDAATLLLSSDFSKSEICLGERRIKLDGSGNLKGTARTLDMLPDGRVICDGQDGKRKFVHYRDPALLENGVCSRSGVALLDDSDSLLLEGEELLPRIKERDFYLFAFGQDYRGAVRALFSLCGMPPLLPRFVFGNWWSRYWAYTDESYLALLDEFAARNIPLTVATLDMDWHYVEVKQKFGLEEKSLTEESIYGETHGWTGYSWNQELFPAPARFLGELKARNLAVTLNLHPASGVRWWETCYPEMAKRMGIDPESGRFVPFDLSNARFREAYFSVMHHPQEKMGVDFWWIDWQQGARSRRGDPLWSLNHYHTKDRVAQGKRALILSRYAGIGSHRYPLGFSGDTIQTWDLLDFMPYFTACAANAGYQFWSHDVGGHHAGIKSAELYLRWIEFAVFNPILRLHSSSGPLFGKEPWNYGEGACAIAIKWLRFRAKLIPWLYTQARRAATCGDGLLEPCYYDDPEEPEAYDYTGQYRFGGMLVAPVTSPADRSGLGEKKVWLPKGEWFDLFSGLRYEGGRTITACRRVGEIPVFCRPGTILPLAAKVENGVALPSALEVWIYPGEGKFVLAEDNDDLFCETTFSVKDAGNAWELEIWTEGDRSLLPAERNCVLRLVGRQSLSCVLRRQERVRLCLDKSIPPRQILLGELYRFLLEQEGENSVLDGLWKTLSGAKSASAMLAAIRGVKIPQRVKRRLRECILASPKNF